MSPLSSLLSRGKGTDPDHAVEDTGPESPLARPDVVVRVNLLPPEIEEAAAFKRGQVVRAGVVAAAVAVVVGGGVLATQSVSSAQSGLDAERATAAQLATQVEALAAVPRTQQQLSSAQTRLAGAMGQQVRWSTYLNALGMVTPRDVSFLDLSVVQTVDLAAPAAGADATAGAAEPTAGVVSAVGNPGIATVTVNGHAKDHTDVAALLNRLARHDANIDPYFSSSTKELDSESDREVVSFTATTTVTDQALTHEFDQKGN